MIKQLKKKHASYIHDKLTEMSGEENWKNIELQMIFSHQREAFIFTYSGIILQICKEYVLFSVHLTTLTCIYACI